MPSILKHVTYVRDLNLTNHINFQSPEVVCRGSDTQLQVTEILKKSI